MTKSIYLGILAAAAVAVGSGYLVSKLSPSGGQPNSNLTFVAELPIGGAADKKVEAKIETTPKKASVAVPVKVSPPPPVIPHNATVSHVVISEVQFAGNGGSTNDFIELWNPTNKAVNISGWKLRKRTASGSESSIRSFEKGSVIPAGGFFLWANSGSGYATSLAADAWSGASIAANNSIALFDADGKIVDAVAWGEKLVSPFSEGAPLTGQLKSGQSLERKSFEGSCLMRANASESSGNGCDTNDNASDFEIREVAAPQNSKSPSEN